MREPVSPSGPYDLPPNGLEAFWMPLTANRRFKREPTFFSRAEGMYFVAPDGRKFLDAIAGLWCVNVGHCHPKVVEAIREQAGKLDYSSSFSIGHPLAFHLAIGSRRLRRLDLIMCFWPAQGPKPSTPPLSWHSHIIGAAVKVTGSASLAANEAIMEWVLAACPYRALACIECNSASCCRVCHICPIPTI